MDYKKYSIDIAGKEVIIELGQYAELSAAACTVRCGDTMVFVTVTASEEPREGIDFFPLNIDFREKLYAVGRIPGSFNRREGKPSDHATLVSRVIDRPLRPLFPKGFRNDVQVVVYTLSIDPLYPCEPLAMIGSSLVLCLSDLPFMGPTGAVTMGYKDGEYIVFPDSNELKESKLNLTVSGTKDAIMMVEAGAQEVTEDVMLEAIMRAHEEIKRIVELQEQITAECGTPKRTDYPMFVPGEDVIDSVMNYAEASLAEAVKIFDRASREEAMAAVEADVKSHFAEEFAGREWEIDEAIYKMTKKVVRARILNEGIRPDGRALTEVRPLTSKVGVIPRVHGSSMFKRGQTQVLSTCTLAPLTEVQLLDGIWPETEKRYMHQYNFPPFSTGEAKAIRTPGRREIGHGALAERALEPVIPSQEEFPYAIRMVSEVMSSNGSTSQASVCASTLSLMDAGVPIKAAVAGCAMGLIKDDETGNVAVLTDIQGMEDFLGDMDFKVAGTSRGITAIQMDIKIKGIDRAILTRALAQAKDGRMFIMRNMLGAISAPRRELSPYAPKITTLKIDVDKISEVIGKGGKVINGIIAATGAKIDIEEDGSVFVYAADQNAGNAAVKMINDIIRDVEIGDVYDGTVKRITDFGAFIEILPNKEGMAHISELDFKRVEKVEDVLTIGQVVKVKVIKIDDQGKIGLSVRECLPKPEGWVERERKPRPERKPFNRERGEKPEKKDKE